MPRSGNARVALVAAVCFVIGLLLNSIGAFVADWTGLGKWLVSNVLGLLGAVGAALFEKSQEPGPEPPSAPGPTGRSTGRRGPTAAGVLTVALAVIIVGGGVTFGVRYVVGLVTGDETGRQVLVQPASGSAAGVSATVDGVEYTDHFTRVFLEVTNGGSSSVSLPLYGYCVLSGSDGTTLEADSSRSDWAVSLPPGGRQRGIVVFSGHLPDAVSEASLSFTTIFGPGGGGALTVGPFTLSPAGLPDAAGAHPIRGSRISHPVGYGSVR